MIGVYLSNAAHRWFLSSLWAADEHYVVALTQADVPARSGSFAATGRLEKAAMRLEKAD